MKEFNYNLEGKIKLPEQLPEISDEVKSIYNSLFKDDFEGLESMFPEKEESENSCNVKDEINKMFSDDFSETDKKSEADENDLKTEMVDLEKQYEPNSKIEINGKIYETDDNGYIYKVDGYVLLPNREYTIGGVTYKTDELGRIISCDGNATSTPDGERDNKAQSTVGGEDRREGDQGGHILARIFGGAKGIENMLAMRGAAINQSVYKRMENEIAKALDEGKEVHVHVDVEYEGDSQRPSKITVTYTIDGKETVVQFDNDEGSTDLLDSLKDKLDEDQYNDLKKEIQEANEDGAKMTVVSVKTEYDEAGNVTRVIVTIRDENSDHPVNEDRVFTPKETA